jgi:phenylalanyl-tRNA synthetase beta chain
MLLSVEWLGDHVDLEDLSPEQVEELYTMHVAEVGGLVEPGGGWPGVVVGDVRAVRPHPDADKLRLVTVATGDGDLEVVCGAPNVAEGQKICFAGAGTTLPGGFVLEKRKIRGFLSTGMVLSERELGLSDEHEGILVLETDAPAGTPLREVLGGGAVLDVDNTGITTRPDLWGHYGAARELAAVLRRELRPLDLGDPPPESEPSVRVTVESPELCPRYLGWAIRGVRVGPSPDWLRRRLEQAGQRSLNNVVDLTNFILLECGQPIHAFDRRQIVDGHIIVRASRPGERVTTLDGVERELPERACVIADPERPVAIAGVMGLANSEVMEDTTEIILEVANFEMTSVRRTAHVLDLRTESAVRFEKGLDPEGVPSAARRFLHLLRRLCPDAEPVGRPCDVRVPPEPPRRIEFADDFIPRRLGTGIDAAEVEDILSRLGFGVEQDGALWRVTVPTWRAGRDVSLPEDLLEEVGRIHGWDRIEDRPLLGDLAPVPVEPERGARRMVRSVLSGGAGLSEIHTYPFTTADACRRAGIEPGTLQLANAEQPGLDLMARSLVPAVMRALSENLKYREEAALYVVAPVFEKESEQGLPRENERLTLGIASRGDETTVFDVKGAVEAVFEAFGLQGVTLRQEEGPPWLHAGRCARLVRGREEFGWLGEIHPRVARAFELEGVGALADLDLDALRTAPARAPRMEPISRFPTVPYDVAVVVDRRTPAAEVEAVLRKADPKRVRAVRLFDVYEGENLPAGKRSLAFSIVFGALDRTLDTGDVEHLRAAVQAAIERKGWTLRT